MSYVINGTKKVVQFVANPRTASTATAQLLMDNKGFQYGDHHADAPRVPPLTLLVQTVRHHCDVLVSYYYKAQQGVAFDYFVKTVLDGQNEYFGPKAFYDHWKVQPNYVLLYENLDFEFSILCEVAGLPQMKIPRTPSRRPRSVKWPTMFSTTLRDQVCERYQEEMELYGYGNH